jgi:hypothetical protein
MEYRKDHPKRGRIVRLKLGSDVTDAIFCLFLGFLERKTEDSIFAMMVEVRASTNESRDYKIRPVIIGLQLEDKQAEVIATVSDDCLQEVEQAFEKRIPGPYEIRYKLYTCPCCKEDTLFERSVSQTCEMCGWVDVLPILDGTQSEENSADQLNTEPQPDLFSEENQMSLLDAQRRYMIYGHIDPNAGITVVQFQEILKHHPALVETTSPISQYL